MNGASSREQTLRVAPVNVYTSVKAAAVGTSAGEHTAGLQALKRFKSSLNVRN